jgi:hypothetical protein
MYVAFVFIFLLSAPCWRILAIPDVSCNPVAHSTWHLLLLASATPHLLSAVCSMISVSSHPALAALVPLRASSEPRAALLVLVLYIST